MLTSDGLPCVGPMLSPPLDWPNVFKEPPLKRFCKQLKGKRCRVTQAPSAAVLSEAAAVPVDPEEGSRQIAELLSRHLGWAIVKGYALFELRARPGTFVAEPRWWNQHPCGGTWVDLAPRDGAHPQLVLVESAESPDAIHPLLPPAAEATASPRAELPPSPIPPPPLLAAAPMAAAPPPAAAEPAPAVGLKELVDHAAQAAEPKPARKARRDERARAGSYRSVEAVWVVVDETKEKGYDGYAKTKRIPFPGRRCQVRMALRPDGTFELEARRWGTADGLRDGAAEVARRSEPEIFAALEYGDEQAAALRVAGTWRESQFDLQLQVLTAEQASNGAAEPPITTKMIDYACGKSRGRPLKCTLSKEHPDLMWVVLNDYLKHTVVMRKESELDASS